MRLYRNPDEEFRKLELAFEKTPDDPEIYSRYLTVLCRRGSPPPQDDNIRLFNYLVENLLEIRNFFKGKFKNHQFKLFSPYSHRTRSSIQDALNDQDLGVKLAWDITGVRHSLKNA